MLSLFDFRSLYTRRAVLRYHFGASPCGARSRRLIVQGDKIRFVLPSARGPRTPGRGQLRPALPPGLAQGQGPQGTSCSIRTSAVRGAQPSGANLTQATPPARTSARDPIAGVNLSVMSLVRRQ